VYQQVLALARAPLVGDGRLLLLTDELAGKWRGEEYAVVVVLVVLVVVFC
jgi:hypothetical protein